MIVMVDQHLSVEEVQHYFLVVEVEGEPLVMEVPLVVVMVDPLVEQREMVVEQVEMVVLLQTALLVLEAAAVLVVTLTEPQVATALIEDRLLVLREPEAVAEAVATLMHPMVVLVAAV